MRLITLISYEMTISHDVAVIQQLILCHKNCMTTHVITLWCIHVTSLTTPVSAMRFLIEILFILKGIKSHLKGHTLVVISYEIYETRKSLIL